MLTIIAAVGENNALGKNNQLLWHLPNDFKHFKNLTTGHTIIMGRKTFESLPGILPNRKHIIITRQKDYLSSSPSCILVRSFKLALELCKSTNTYVIGGGEIYALAMPFVSKIELTRVHCTLDADTFFPEIDADDWQLVSKIHHEKDEKHLYNYTFETYISRRE